MPTRANEAWSRVRWCAIGAVPFSALVVSTQTSGADYAVYFLRAISVWMGFAVATSVLEAFLNPKSKAGWSRFFAFAACGAADGLWSAQWWPLSLGDASPIAIGLRATLLWMLGSAWIRAMTNIDRANPPKLPSIGKEGAGELGERRVPQAG